MIDWLAATFLATSLLMALVLLVRESVRRLFGPAAAYGLWLIPALRLLMPTLTTTVERTVPAARPLSITASHSPAPLLAPITGPSMVTVAKRQVEPGLADSALYEGRDLKPTTDLDALIAGALRSIAGSKRDAC